MHAGNGLVAPPHCEAPAQIPGVSPVTPQVILMQDPRFINYLCVATVPFSGCGHVSLRR